MDWATVVASVISILGLFLYGFLAWVFKRLINQLDQLTEITTKLHKRVLKLEKKVKKSRQQKQRIETHRTKELM